MSEPLDLDLEPIKERLNAATKGPWVAIHDVYGYSIATEDGESFVVDCDGQSPFPNYGDVAFIAATRTDIPALIAEVERLRTILADLDSQAAKEAK